MVTGPAACSAVVVLLRVVHVTRRRFFHALSVFAMSYVRSVWYAYPGTTMRESRLETTEIIAMSVSVHSAALVMALWEFGRVNELIIKTLQVKKLHLRALGLIDL